MASDPVLTNPTGTGPLPGGTDTSQPLLPGSEAAPTMPEPAPADADAPPGEEGEPTDEPG